MTRLGYRALVAALLLFMAGGSLLALPSLPSFSPVVEESCADWAANPRPLARVRLRNCHLEPRGATILLASAEPGVPLIWAEPDPAAQAFVSLHNQDEAVRQRWVARHGARLTRRHVEGSISTGPLGWVLYRPLITPVQLRFFGGVLALIAALGLLWVTLAQRRWTARREELLGSQPTRF